MLEIEMYCVVDRLTFPSSGMLGTILGITWFVLGKVGFPFKTPLPLPLISLISFFHPMFFLRCASFFFILGLIHSVAYIALVIFFALILS
jgi:hypothetical protein